MVHEKMVGYMNEKIGPLLVFIIRVTENDFRTSENAALVLISNAVHRAKGRKNNL